MAVILEIAREVGLFAAGLAFLLAGSHYLLEGAVSLARRFNVSKVIIGITVVSLGSSLPEFCSDVYAVLKGQGLFAVGVVAGSNVTNIALVLAMAAVLARGVSISKGLVRRDGTVMILVSVLLWITAIGGLSRLEGVLFLFLMTAYLFLLFSQRHARKDEWEDRDGGGKAFKSLAGGVGASAGGALGILIGTKLAVDSSIALADRMGVSQGVIGLTLMAFGTSLPELFVTVGAVLKKQPDISVGNVFGSNIFNILLILGSVSVMSPLPVDRHLMVFAFPAMLAFTVAVTVVTGRNRRLGPVGGLAYLALFLVFVVLNYSL